MVANSDSDVERNLLSVFSSLRFGLYPQAHPKHT